MEIDEIKNYWKEEDRRISENVKINRDVSFQKLRSSFDKVRIRRLFYIVQMCILVPLILALVVFPRLKNDHTILFYLSVISFVVPILFFFSTSIYYYICLLKIDFTVSLVKAQKEILRLEMFEKKLNVLGLIVIPLVTLSTFKNFGIPFNWEAMLMIALIVLTMIISYIVKIKVLISREYRKVKSYLDEIANEEE
ncbi:MAG: hypothetical protein LBV74_07285 [Tannerella sp.]|jgi:hypothetical protein|nr:hypothetical protein [Tannerella sp.]